MKNNQRGLTATRGLANNSIELVNAVDQRAPPIRILRRAEVTRIVGLQRAWIYLLMQEGKFPTPVKLGVRAVGWVESEIQAWLAERVKQKAAAEPGASAVVNEQKRLAGHESSAGRFISTAEYEELKRLRRFEKRVKRLLPHIQRTVNSNVFDPRGKEFGENDED